MSSSPTLATEPQPDPTRAVAPAWHTAVILLVLLGLSLAGARGADQMFTSRPNGRVVTYLSVMVIEWLMAAFIWYGMRGRGINVASVVGGGWARPKKVLRDIGIALGFLVVSSAVLNGLGHLLKTTTPDSVRKALPQSAIEIALWVLVALTAGFCEELIFRGYLQRQFSALTRSIIGGIVLQGIVFGAAHGYQGWKLMLSIAVFGTMFGMLAQWRHSLRPGMLAHFLQDGVGGILGRHLMR
jgi:membrane protease YdiL (CAAX protease family)